MLGPKDEPIATHVGHVLRHIWNPIGLGPEGPDDEYDSYVPGVVALARDTTVFEAVIVAHLLRVETERMGLTPARAPATRAARAILGLREAAAAAPDQLVSQNVSADGLRCFWIFRRPDGLHWYEQVALEHETDENGAISWWKTAGEGRSGLFDTADAAERDARGTIGWLE